MLYRDCFKAAIEHKESLKIKCKYEKELCDYLETISIPKIRRLINLCE